MEQPVGILCALPAERGLLVGALEEAVPAPGPGLEAQVGRLDGTAVVVATCGVGKVDAAATATLLVERLRCRALVLSGVAGGLSPALHVGDLVIAERLIDIDYGRITDGGRIVYQPGTLPLPGVEPDPGFRLSEELARRVRERIVGAGIDVVYGTVLSGDAFLASAQVRDELAARWSALAIEMEGAGVCGVAERFGVPWLIVRALSDRAGEDSAADFATFVASAAARSTDLVRTILPILADRRLVA
jgi:adenosylhomocysteine nucleosidase